MITKQNAKKTEFLQKSTCGYRALTVEPPSPAAQRCTNGAPDGPKRRRRRNEVEEKSEVNEAGRAKEVRAHPVTFVSTLFEIDR